MRRFRHTLFALLSALLILPTLGCGSKDDDDPKPEPVEQRATYQRVAIWNSVLQSYPDLPEKIATIVNAKEQPPKEKPTEVKPERAAVEVTLHGQDVNFKFTAQTIDVIVTDLSPASLRELHKFLLTVPEQARKLNINHHSHQKGKADPSAPRGCIIRSGSEGTCGPRETSRAARSSFPPRGYAANTGSAPRRCARRVAPSLR